MIFPAPDFLRTLSRAAALAMAAAVLCQTASGRQNPAPAHRNPVLIELFTSEGCSDCPPADAALAQLDTQVIPDAQVIVLSEHVTYWNYLGWSDPFSFDEMDQRQQSYVRQFGLDSPATPQFVVDGTTQLAGNNPRVLAGLIARAAATPKIQLDIQDAHRLPDGAITFTVRAAGPGNASLVAAIAENATRSEVARGENAGRTLHHVAVVRIIKDFGSDFGSGPTGSRTLELSGASLLRAEKDGQPLRLVVLLVSHKDFHVAGAAEQTLNP
jgi:hypothetical protein